MESQEGVERLFFELSSESRLGILHELQKEDLRTMEIARRLDLTGTEAFRQLHRLSDAMLVQRQPEGSYSITHYGKLVLQLSSSYEFVFKHREYFLTHDIWQLPIQFVNRIGELSQTDLKMDTMDNINKAEKMLGEAEQYVWGLGEGYFTETMSAIGEKGIRKGVEYRVLSPLPPAILQNLENRTLSDIPVIFVLTEREAFICFRFIDGRADYAGFFGKNPVFLNWVRDLFLFYWDKEKRT